MKQIASSQFMGKWYSIARAYNRFEMEFFDIFVYVSVGCEKYLELLYVPPCSVSGYANVFVLPLS